MEDKTAQRGEDLLTMYKTTLLDFPLAGARWGLGMGQEKEVVEATWKGYDAWVRSATASIDDLYRNPLFGDLLARSLDRWLRWQRLSQTMAGAFFAALWPAVGLPTAAAVQALHEELHSLDARFKAQDAAVQTLRAEIRALETLRKESRSVTVSRSTQSPIGKISLELAERRAALPAQRNGNGAGNHAARAVLQKKLAGKHGTKDRRKNNAITA